MVVLNVFTKNVTITYKSTLLSKATLLVFCFGVLAVLLPFILAYKSAGFWMKRDVFYEQPDVKFKGEYIFVATTSNLAQPIITCSTLPFYQQVLSFLDHCSLIKVRENDRNFDNKVDQLDLGLQVNLPRGTHLTSISVIIPLDYKLHDVCHLQMQAAVIYQAFLPVPISTYQVMGDVVIAQSEPLQCQKTHINDFYNYSIIPNEQHIDDYALDNIITEYSQRNLSTVLSNQYIRFLTRSRQIFDLQVKLRYPEDCIYYKPHFWQILKWAWIQYFAMYVIISWIVTKVKNYVFNRRLVLYYEVNPVKKKL